MKSHIVIHPFAVLYCDVEDEFCIKLFDDLLEAIDFQKLVKSEGCDIAVVMDADFASSSYIEFWR